MQAMISCRAVFPDFLVRPGMGIVFFGILHACSMTCGTASCGDLLIQESWSILSLTLGAFPGKYCLPTHPAIGEAISRSLCSNRCLWAMLVPGLFEFELFTAAIWEFGRLFRISFLIAFCCFSSKRSEQRRYGWGSEHGYNQEIPAAVLWLQCVVGHVQKGGSLFMQTCCAQTVVFWPCFETQPTHGCIIVNHWSIHGSFPIQFRWRQTSWLAVQGENNRESADSLLACWGMQVWDVILDPSSISFFKDSRSLTHSLNHV